MRAISLLLFLCCFPVVSVGQAIAFSDPAFKARLLTSDPFNNPVAFDQDHNYVIIDANADSEIDQAEALAVYEMSLGAGEITDLTGLSYFTNLRTLSISDNPITSLDVSSLSGLKRLSCNWTPAVSILLNAGLEDLTCLDNELTSLDVSICTNLKALRCSYNSIPTLDVSGLAALETLICEHNGLTALDIAGLSQLQVLECGHNHLASLDLHNKNVLGEVRCNDNQIIALDFNGVGTALPDMGLPYFIDCSGNLMETIDVSVMGDRRINLTCGRNPLLAAIYARNGQTFFDQLNTEPPYPGPTIYFEQAPALEYVCVDAVNIPFIEAKIANYGYSAVVVDDACALQVRQPQKTDFAVFPNPVSNILYLNGPISEIRVTDITGREVLHCNLAAGQLDVSALSPQVYFLSGNTGATRIIKRFIKE